MNALVQVATDFFLYFTSLPVECYTETTLR